jgi:DHA2 family multidrug resistance protein
MAGAGAAQGEWTPERSAAGRRSPWLIAVIISLATFMEVLDTSIANVSLYHIAGGLSSSYDEATWVLTSYLIANAVVMPVSGWLSNVIGRKRFYMFSVALFTASSLLCGLSTSLTMLVLSRIAQGIGGAGLAPSEQSMLSDTFPPSLRSRAFALYGFTVVLGPVVGPMLGGWITDATSSWRWIFFINIPVGILSLFLVNIFVEEAPKLVEDRRRLLSSGFRIDYLGLALTALALGSLEFVLDRGQRSGWFASSAIRLFAAASALGFVALVVRELTVRTPVIDLRLLKNRSYAASLLAMLASGAVAFSSTQLLPQFLQQVLGYTAFDAGLALALGGLGTFLMLPLTGGLAIVVRPKYLMMLGVLVEAAAFWNFTRFTADIDFSQAALAQLWLGIGLPLLFIPINLAAYADTPPEKSNEVAAQLNLMRNLGASMGISFAQTLIQRRGQWHQLRLVETLTLLDRHFRAWLADASRGVHAPGGPTGLGMNKAALGVIMRSVEQQATVLAFLDTFKALMIVTLCLAPLVFLLKRTEPGALPGL